MISAFARRVGRAIRDRGLWARGDRVAVAVSGGADSVALLCALAELAPDADWVLAGAIHVNHGLRGEAAASDAAFCLRLGDRLGVPVEVVLVDVRERMGTTGQSLESAARDLRYAALAEAAVRLRATVVATGHTRDDQAETVLLRLLRGTSIRGVSGIRARRGVIARPLLDRRRTEVEKYLADRGESFQVDASNTDERIPRNRLRHTLMPVLERDWPGSASALARFAELAADDDAWLGQQARQAGQDVVRGGPAGVELDRGRLRTLPRALARRVVRDAIEAAGGHASFRDVEAILRLGRGDASGRILTLRGLRVRREAGAMVLEPAGTPGGAAAPLSYMRGLPVPGETTIPETGVVISTSVHMGPVQPELRRSAGPVVALQSDRLVLPLTVRSRRPGDRLRPAGAPGTRKLQDLLVDRKIPCGERDRVPIVVDGTGQIVWVAGVAVAEAVRVTAPESGMVILEIKKDAQ